MASEAAVAATAGSKAEEVDELERDETAAGRNVPAHRSLSVDRSIVSERTFLQ